MNDTTFYSEYPIIARFLKTISQVIHSLEPKETIWGYFNPMAPNHHVTLGHELPESTDQASPDSKAHSISASTVTADGDPSCSSDSADRQEPYLPLKWVNIISIGTFHALALYGFYVGFTECMWRTVLWSYVLGQMGGIGVTAGAHRLWTHRSYKANVPLRSILAIFYSIAGQNTIFDWVRDHRVHHKYSETNADPHNANRGFFFAHVGWLLQRKHPDVIEKGRSVDMSDITNDPVVKFHTKFFFPFQILFCFVIPSVVPVYFWNETWRCSIFVALFTRYVLGLNFTWLVNSAAHIWGNKPYDKQIFPAQNKFVAVVALGEGWHNYHHVFPWDYKTAELGDYGYNYTTAFIDFFAWLGWAYDLKVASPDLVKKRALRTGDGTHETWGTVGGEVIPAVENSEFDEYGEQSKHE